jgi:hypothetical protein
MFSCAEEDEYIKKIYLIFINDIWGRKRLGKTSRKQEKHISWKTSI